MASTYMARIRFGKARIALVSAIALVSLLPTGLSAGISFSTTGSGSGATLIPVASNRVSASDTLAPAQLPGPVSGLITSRGLGQQMDSTDAIDPIAFSDSFMRQSNGASNDVPAWADAAASDIDAIVTGCNNTGLLLSGTNECVRLRNGGSIARDLSLIHI